MTTETRVVSGRRAAGCSVALAVILAVVGTSAATASGGAPAARAKQLSGTITVSAAASLTDAFAKLAADFERANPGTTITTNFAASSALVTQIQGGAPADVFASADGTNMQKVVSGGEVTAEPTVFAANELTIVVRKANPKHVKSLADLADVGTVALCAEAVPCGRYASQALSQAGVTIPPGKVTRGADVKATLSAVSTGDADAAIVYTTDARAAGSSVGIVRIPAWLNVYAVYPIAPIAASPNLPLAGAFVRYTVSPAGRKTLQSFGFLPPPLR
jgi:molybdate transport system substrate-binding protein